jgi:tetratricopeptide (TPR) repeat protein
MKGPLALALCLALGACNSLTSQNEPELASYLGNAEQYYEGGHFQRAYQQWDQALKLDPDNRWAQLGQAMCLYQLGRAETPEAMKPLGQATERIERLRREGGFDRDHWKVDLASALVHQRWADLYDRKLRRIDEDRQKGVPPDQKTLDISKAEFVRHVAEAEKSFKAVLAGEEKAPRDRLTCWVGLAQIAFWRGDLEGSLKHADLYLKQVLRSEELWRSAAQAQPGSAAVFHGKLTGAQLQEAELRDLMGAVLFRLGRTDEAEKELNQVIALFPDRAPPYLNRGIIRQMRGDDDLARGDFRKFLVLTDLPDNDPSILEATRRMAEVEGRLAAAEAREGEPATFPPRR